LIFSSPQFAMLPQKILLIKSHSLGVGDILRSSAAWQALQNRYPTAELHLLFLSRHAGYPSEELIREHHLLKSAHFVTIREADPSQPKARRVPLHVVKAEVQRISATVKPDMVIDFEASGLRTSLVTRWVAQASQSKTVGIAQFLGRGWLYDQSAPSTRAYLKKHGLTAPMDYTERDFVVLAALGIERQGQAISLQMTQAGRDYRGLLLPRLLKDRRVIGLNIGCGTPDAAPRRPPLASVAAAIHALAQLAPTQLLLVGAKFEKDVNQAFIQLFRQTYGDALPMIDVAGETSLSGATGAIGVCDLFMSSDSGPYHMAVAQKMPTLAWFMRDEPAAYHRVAWCRCLITPQPSDVLAAAQSLLGSSTKPSEPSLNSAA
jgi:ADP-heptose:LPS heptosyltransferase